MSTTSTLLALARTIMPGVAWREAGDGTQPWVVLTGSVDKVDVVDLEDFGITTEPNWQLDLYGLFGTYKCGGDFNEYNTPEAALRALASSIKTEAAQLLAMIGEKLPTKELVP